MLKLYSVIQAWFLIFFLKTNTFRLSSYLFILFFKQDTNISLSISLSIFVL